MTKEMYTLSNGVKIPKIGFGTWRLPDGEVAYEAVRKALETGYRHIDTAQNYQNEASVGRAVANSGLKRQDIFITTKIENPNATYEETLKSIEDSLEKLQSDYLDLLLIHWPNPVAHRQQPGFRERNKNIWRALEEKYQDKTVRAIGVSNFLPHHFEALLETAEIIPMVNQIKLAPGLLQEETVAYSRDKNILLEAYSPLGTGGIFNNEVLISLAEKYNRTVAQIALRWSLEHDFLPLPRSQTPANIESNFKIFDFSLAKDDIQLMDGLAGLTDEPDPDQTDF